MFADIQKDKVRLSSLSRIDKGNIPSSKVHY